MTFPHIITTSMIISDITQELRDIADENDLEYTRYKEFGTTIIALKRHTATVHADNPFDFQPETYQTMYHLKISDMETLPIYDFHDNPLESEETYQDTIKKFRDHVTEKITS